MKNVKISRNQQLNTLHVKNVTEWLQNTNHKVVRGDTLFFDYIFFIHPTAIGHWCDHCAAVDGVCAAPHES